MLEDSSFSFFFFKKSYDCNEIREFFFVILFSLFFSSFFFSFGRSCSRFLINRTHDGLASNFNYHFQSFDYFGTKRSYATLQIKFNFNYFI